ncbi:twin-arginine translocase subunit TatC [Acidimicrobiales bacterium]|nr:twin-arginine translocase subunit TatC [bacterium]MDB9846054.1 twin-arginine translocase subunit TatC [Acidimicrobiales bacterium]
MSLIDHLTELRKRIIISVVAVAVGAVVAYIFYNRILEFLLEPHCQINGDDGLLQGCGLLARSPLEGFSVRLMVSTYTGVGIAMPIILWQLWSFVAPGLYPQERKYGLSFVVLSFVLFAFGAGLAYWSLPRALEFLVDVGGPNLENVYSPKEYIGFVVKMMLGFGLGFEFPIVLIFMQLIGLVDNKMLRAGRRFALVGIVALVAVLTPSGDPYTLMVLSVPMYLFYEISIAFGWWRSRKQSKNQKQSVKESQSS